MINPYTKSTQNMSDMVGVLDVRYHVLRKKLDDLRDSDRGWGADIELAINDVLSVINTLVTEDDSDDDSSIVARY